MKKSIVLFALAACVSSLAVNAQDNHDNKTKIVGSGNVVTKEIPVQSFDQLDAKGVFSLVLTQGDKESLKIEAEDNLQQYFEVRNEGSKLYVDMKKDVNFDTKKKIKIYITFHKLKAIDLKTVGDISSTNSLVFENLKIDNKSVGSVDLNVTAQSLDIDNKSVGDVRLNGKADHVVIRNKGVGSIQAASFIVQDMDIENSGVGSAEVNAAKELKVKDSMMGKVKNKGAATARKKVAI
ncbi:MAG TPA: head GIN domain-containing protein [Chitinophagaceae bacterium]|nr:head GIN domain-containing protein [Chitinophagaceae bacterium]